MAKKAIVIAIDGRCAAGKTTLAGALAVKYDASVIHMDNFFLPPWLRSGERYAEVGGNIHYERFYDEVICGLRSGRDFSYRVFDCSAGNFTDVKKVQITPLIIVEGAYSLRPEFRSVYDIKVFLDIKPEEQKKRIIMRNGEKNYSEFKNKWIPLEEKYFIDADIKSYCDFCFS